MVACFEIELAKGDKVKGNLIKAITMANPMSVIGSSHRILLDKLCLVASKKIVEVHTTRFQTELGVLLAEVLPYIRPCAPFANVGAIHVEILSRVVSVVRRNAAAVSPGFENNFHQFGG